MNFHIVGSTGFIGQQLVNRTIDSYNVFTYSRHKDDIFFDLTERNESLFDNISTEDYVVFLAAISSPDMCDKNYDHAYSINVLGTKWFIENCIKRGANVLFLSSDVVNGACDTPVDETAQTHPFGHYAKMKDEVEKYFSAEKNVKTFRLSYVFSKHDKFMNYLIECSKQNKVADVFNALYRSVVYIEDVLDGIVRLSTSFHEIKTATFNLSGPNLLSRADLAKMYKDIINPNFEFNLSTPADDFFLSRPNTINTKSIYVETLLGRSPTRIDEAMKKEF